MSIETIVASGILFAGDLHLSSRAPSRRCDDYASAGLEKVRQLVEIANANQFVLVLLGDVFHSPIERSEALKTRLLRTLGDCWTTVLCNVGNHDKEGLRLSDADTLSVISEPGRPLRAMRESGPAFEVAIGSQTVGLGFTPYGQEIPSDTRGMFPHAKCVLWATHHDIGFEGAYPGAVDPYPIPGCQLVLNGHMHIEKAEVNAGGTLWCNFGSTMRTAIDALAHEPCAWSFAPGTGLTRHPLRVQHDVFDLTSRLVDEASPGEVVAAASTSVFVALLKAAREEAQPYATADGTLLHEALEAKLGEAAARPEVRAMVLDLHRRAVERRAAAAAT